MRGKINKNAFLQCLGPTLLSQEKAPMQSQLADTPLLLPCLLCPIAEWKILAASIPSGPGIHAPIWLINTVRFSTMVTPCSCLGAVDLEKVTMRAMKSINMCHTKRIGIIYNAWDTEIKKTILAVRPEHLISKEIQCLSS